MKLIIILTLLTFSTIVNGNNVERLDVKFKSLYLTGNMVLWKQAVDSLRLTKTDTQTEMVLLYAEYGLIGNYLGAKQQDLAKVEIPLFEKRIEQALKRRPNDAALHAFSAALVAYKIGLQPWKAPFYSRSHTENLRKAMELGPELGLPLVEQANSLYFRPSLFGGDKARAVEYYEKAFEFFKKNNRNHWMYYNVGAWLGQVYAKQGQTSKAETMYLQLLKEAPNFKWVKEDLLPTLRAGKNSPDYFNDLK